MDGSKIRNHGFTIVELLIVIVVIAILAAITIVAYNGIQARANDARTASTVRNYVQMFKLYKVDKGDFPIPSIGAGGITCLGENYPAADGFALNSCYIVSGSSAADVDATVNTALKTTSKQLPSTLDIKTATGSDGRKVRGLIYVHDPANANIQYFYSGNKTTCPIGTQAYDAGTNTTSCTILLNS